MIYIPISFKDVNNYENFLTDACVDTGSNQTIISWDLAEFLGVPLEETRTVCKEVKDINFSADYEAIVTICLKDFKFKMKVYVVYDFQDDILLGSDFLEKAKAQIDYLTNKIKIQTNNPNHFRKKFKKISFKCKDKVSIPARSYKIIDIESSQNITDLTEIEPCIKLAKIHKLFVSNSLYIPEDNTSKKVLIANYCDSEKHVFKGKKKIGYKSEHSDFNIYIRPTISSNKNKINRTIKIKKIV